MDKKRLLKLWITVLSVFLPAAVFSCPARAGTPERTAAVPELTAAGWNQTGDLWWYSADETGETYCKDGWFEIDGAMYCFDKDGWLLENTVTPDDRIVGDGGQYAGTAQAPARSAEHIITVGEGGDVPTIQGAVDYLAYHRLDRKESPWIIQVLPGTYPRFTTKNARTGFWDPRYLNIAGTDRELCIVKDGSGEYLTPPAEICLNGTVKNLQFIATHDSAPPLLSRAPEYRKSYAVHMDFGTQKVLFDNCAFTSYQAPAIGAGISDGEEITFTNCEFSGMGEPMKQFFGDERDIYTWLTDFGAFYVHSDMPMGGQAVLTLENCRIYSKNGANSLSIFQTEDRWLPESTHLTVRLIGNHAWSDRGNAGANILIEHKFDGLEIAPESSGNNFDDRLQMNAASYDNAM